MSISQLLLKKMSDDAYEIVYYKKTGQPMYKPFKLNSIRKNNMFNDEELKFIQETTTRDLPVVQAKIEHVINELARLGKQLSDLKIVEAKLKSIAAAIKDSQEDEDGCDERCCR